MESIGQQLENICTDSRPLVPPYTCLLEKTQQVKHSSLGSAGLQSDMHNSRSITMIFSTSEVYMLFHRPK
jgi:hypothetical protein